MKNLTVCILAHERTAVLADVCRSIAWADQVLILDNSSQVEWDRYFTPETALQIEKITEPITDFAAVRNQALALCRTDWIFFIDSDEVLQAGAEIEILRVTQSASAVGGVVTRSDVFQGKQLSFGEAGAQPQLRLCKVAATQFVGAVHERPVLHGDILPTDIQILHYAHQSVSEFTTAVAQYAQLAATEQRFADMSKLTLIAQLSCFPILKFLQNYILRAGFRDGFAGLVYASCMSLHSLLVRLYAYERYHTPTTS